MNTPTHTLDPTRGWYCPKCNAIYFNTEMDNKHLDHHISIYIWTELAELNIPTRYLKPKELIK